MTNKLFDLGGKVAVVTGGNGGIGKGIADGLASAGATIVIAARNQSKTDAAVRDIESSYGVRVSGLQVDVTGEDDVQNMVKTVMSDYGRIDILVNNAGVNLRKLPQEYSIDEWDTIVNVHLKAPFLCSQAVYPEMKKAGGGKIINIGSMTSILGGAKLTPYGTSKGGIVQMTRSLAVAWAPDNIQVNVILPGWILTEMGKNAQRDIPGLKERVLDRTPAGRWGQPEDFAGIAVFLAGPASDFLTGVAVPVDGGFSIFLI
jgi:2-deoxy-D-gluconate 3-dehydrogenase